MGEIGLTWPSPWMLVSLNGGVFLCGVGVVLLLDRDGKRMFDSEFSCSPISKRVRERGIGREESGIRVRERETNGERRIKEVERGDKDWRKG